MRSGAQSRTTVWRRRGRSSWCEVAGSGSDSRAPVVFLHGLGGSAGSWKPQLSDLGRDRRCLAWDMPGYGDAPPEDPLTFPAIAGRLVELLDDVGLDGPVDLVGLSFGGQHALHTVLAAPRRVRRMVLISTSAVFGGDGTEPDAWRAARLAGLDALPPGPDRMSALAPLVLDGIAGRPLDPATRAELIEAFARIPESGLRAAIDCLPTHDVVDRLAEIDRPTLVVVGELDQETPPSYGTRLVEGIAGARLVSFPGVGHLVPSEDPDGCNRAVRTFLDAPDDPGRLDP